MEEWFKEFEVIVSFDDELWLNHKNCDNDIWINEAIPNLDKLVVQARIHKSECKK